MDVKIEPSWKQALQEEFLKEYFVQLTNDLRLEYKKHTVFPAPNNIFRAFDLCPLEKTKVVILGQDPYHTPGIADGLAFSTLTGNRIPPSLQNIYKEIIAEFDIENYPNLQNPDLSRWANQGVLLLNNTLTVRSGIANSHANFGWEIFTNAVISIIAKERKNTVFILWGNFARGKKSIILESGDGNEHLILESAHPSPFSAHNGFFGNGHFAKCNQFLQAHKYKPITW
jgi:uracil-DNA glycosylase